MGIDLDPLDDLFDVGAKKNARAEAKFQPKSKLQKPRTESASSFTSSHVVQINDTVEGKLSEPIATAKPSDHNDQLNSGLVSLLYEKVSAEDIEKVDSSHSCQDVPVNDNGGWHSCMEKLTGENADIFIGLESLDDFIPPTTTDIGGTVPAKETIVTVPNLESGGGLAISALSSVDDSIQTSESAGKPNVSGSDGVGHMDNIELERGASRQEKTGTNKAPAASDISQLQEKAFTEQGRTLRPRKSKQNQCELEDDSENEVLASKEFSGGCSGCSVLEEDNINNQEYQMESESQSKYVKRKSKQPNGDKGKNTGKRKMAEATSEQDANTKPKKFSHSTRRRKVDKVLLETPEDEIDYQKVPFRDLILLAEYKERLKRKEEAVAGAPSTKESNHESSQIFNEDESFSSKRGETYNDGHVSPRVEESSFYLNYQTYMDRTPVARWSKQDTELFYEAVQQFGTDLSLIQQLFPGRTRRQVKLKYKKEERQHPMRLREALTNRAKDHSHFEKVIERLNQIAAEENENADKDGSTELRDNDAVDEGIPDINDEETKSEANKEDANEEYAGTGQELAEDASPLKPYDSEDDLFRWSQYRSDT